LRDIITPPVDYSTKMKRAAKASRKNIQNISISYVVVWRKFLERNQEKSRKY